MLRTMGRGSMKRWRSFSQTMSVDNSTKSKELPLRPFDMLNGPHIRFFGVHPGGVAEMNTFRS